ncbi:nuclear transport factor 2 family protein [Mesorhizobium sp. YC-39]|uniref:nuclear transport factor 2 family protein n=1 Tax=unclassified Mesorhizobium TaxID=325217 RepID=UPI0021E998C5|nr:MULTISPECIES: nuclear transport factor 2 family protein [unclassified Mesorhizobium]MCV3207976.1 nuclear transport factor 2 family protein [Mesorhizobium sp. YC-2]MCV3229703.1 nuclear transport factor 2 family protein [Mesorhizobium sp. YC-39]
MTVTLPRPLADYFAAKNRHDIDGMLVPFSSDAMVRDEGEIHQGTPAIRAWMEATTRKYQVTVEVADATANGDIWRVAGVVSGNFPGSPATLHYNFTLAGEQITRLEIGA